MYHPTDVWGHMANCARNTCVWLSLMVWLSTTTWTPSLLGGGLGRRCCATWASGSSDSPPWQSRRTSTIFSTSMRKNTCGRSKDASVEVCSTGAHCGQRPWLCYVSGAAPSRLPRIMRNVKRLHTSLQNSPTTSCTPTPNFSLLLDVASHCGVAGKHRLPFSVPCSA